ncbi:hypothetical protein [Nesterenkonia sp. F]|uniref:hypothetical protein n=1 Tax=Nesterenkonia sp. F TaxID=795955 RepID=UPI000255D083|nr:hypothetical protein [Nesterenkonia sp. F]
MPDTPDSALDASPVASAAPRLLRDGTVHSTTEPYAEAMIVEDGLVAWVGSDETAEHLRGEQHVVEELDRALAAPAFVGWARRPLTELADVDDVAAATSTVLSAQAAQGAGTLRLSLAVGPEELADARRLRARLEPVLTAAAAHPLDVHPLVAVDAGPETATETAAALESLLQVALDDVDRIAGRPVGVELTGLWPDGGSADMAEADAALTEAVAAIVQAGRQPVLTLPEGASTSSASVVVERLEGLRSRLRELRASPRPDRPLLLLGFDTSAPELWRRVLDTAAHVVLRGPGHLAPALSTGVPISAVPAEGENPWSLISAHVHHPEAGVSVRAGFNAQSRGAFRSLAGEQGQAGPGGGGQLNPGSAATYAIWQVDSLAVQTPDARTAAWSTDVRARTPLLPYLDGVTLPGLVALVVDGQELHRAQL